MLSLFIYIYYNNRDGRFLSGRPGFSIFGIW